MICFTCFKQTSAFPCVHCLQHEARHVVGADPTPTDAPSMIQNDAQVAAQPTTASDVKYTGWDDLQLLYPPLWPSWLAGKTIDQYDPSQEKDPGIKRTELAAVAKQLNTVIDTCTKVPQADRDGWVSFSKGFIVWFNQDVGMLDRAADASQGEAYQDMLRNWQIEIAKYCNIGMPILPKATPSWGQIASDVVADVGKYLDTTKTIFLVGALLIIGTIYVFGVGNTRKFLVRRALP